MKELVTREESRESEIRDLSFEKSRGRVFRENWGQQINVLNKESERENVIDVESKKGEKH